MKRCNQYYFLIPLIFFVIITYLVWTNEIILLDTQIYSKIKYIINPFTTELLKIITLMGSSVIMIFITISVYFKNKKAGKILGINLTIIYLTNELIKYVFTRTRPNILRLTQASGYSFPSGHSMVSFCFYGICIYLIMKSNFPYKKWISFFLGLVIILIGFSRIYLGVHYFSDVIGGYLFSLTYILIIINKFSFET